MQGLGAKPVLGEVEIFLAHIGKDDYQKLKENRMLFNMLLRRCGGIPIKDFDNRTFCASIAFTCNLFREDFARELENKTGIYVVIDFRRAYIDRKYLPLVESYDKYDFGQLSKKATENRRIEKLENNEPDYYYPTGKQVDGKEI